MSLTYVLFNRFNGNLSTKHNGMLPQRARRTITTRRLASGSGRNKFPNKYQECYHQRKLCIHTENSISYSPSTGKTNSGGVMVEREYWSNNAGFPDEYKTVKDVVTRLHVAVAKSKRLIVTSSTEEDSVEFNFADGHGISPHDTFDVLGFKGVQDPNRSGYFIGNNNKVKKQTQPIKGDFPAHDTTFSSLTVISLNSST